MDTHPFSPMSIQSVPVNSITFGDWTLSERQHPNEIGELAASMASMGLMQPVLVAQRDEGYLLVFGARRLHAARQLGWQAIPAFVCDWDDPQCAAAALAENVQSKPLSFLQMSLLIEDCVSKCHVDRTSLPHLLGKSQEYLQRVAEISGYLLDVQLMLHAAPWTIWAAAKIDRIVNEETRHQFIARAITHSLTVAELDAALSETPPARTGVSYAVSPGPVPQDADDEDAVVNVEIYAPSPSFTSLMSTLIAAVRTYRLPESLDGQADVTARICDTITHLLYVFLCVRPGMRSRDMIQAAINRAPTLPTEWRTRS